MEDRTQYIIRIKNCINTILEVKRSLERAYGDIAILREINGLESAGENIDPERVSERDVFMLEEATNNLMRELEFLWKMGGVRHLYKEIVH
jgi:hypothetical protein